MLIEAHNLLHRIADRTILELAEFRVTAGEHVLLLGPSGSGKTTLINILTGLTTPTSGTVLVDGRLMTGVSAAARDALRRDRIGLVFQTLRLVSALTVRQNLSLAQNLGPGGHDPAEVDSLISRVGLSHRADARPRDLSQGESQRAAIARALCTRPALLVADEPTSALDDANALSMIDLLLSSAAASGSTLLIATHDHRIRSRFAHAVELQSLAVAA